MRRFADPTQAEFALSGAGGFSDMLPLPPVDLHLPPYLLEDEQLVIGAARGLVAELHVQARAVLEGYFVPEGNQLVMERQEPGPGVAIQHRVVVKDGRPMDIASGEVVRTRDSPIGKRASWLVVPRQVQGPQRWHLLGREVGKMLKLDGEDDPALPNKTRDNMSRYLSDILNR